MAAAQEPPQKRPTISGTAQVGETLTVDTLEISDEDGMENAVLSYPWIAGGVDIEGATGPSYTIIADDEGLIIQVRVSFTDDDGNYEALTSDGTEAGATGAAGLPRRSDCRPARDGGLHRHGGHLHRGPQAPVQPAGGDGARTGRVGPRVRRTVRGQGPAPPRQRGEHRGPPTRHDQLPQRGG